MNTSFTAYPDQLGTRFGFELPSRSVGARFGALAEMTEASTHPLLTRTVVARGVNGRKNVAKSINQTGSAPVSDYAPLLAEYLFSLLCKSMPGRADGEADVPVLHHWVPNSYLKHFGDRDRPWNCRIHLRRTVFPANPSGAVIHDYVTGKHFRHGKTNGGGFFDDIVEIFFGNVEHHYINAVDGLGELSRIAELNRQGKGLLHLKDPQAEKKYVLAVLALFVVQSIRATVADPIDRVRTLADVIDAMLGTLDSLGAIDAALVVLPETESIPFLVFSPTVHLDRPARMVGCQRVHHFPITPNAALLFADRGGKLDQLLAGTSRPAAVLEYNDGLIESARIGGESVYGAHLPWAGETVSGTCLCSSFERAPVTT